MTAPRGAYAYYVVACLMLASAFSFLDRLALSLLIDPIRHDLGLSDSEVSLLAGAAFASCYVLFAFLFGRWVDVRGRRNVVVVGMSLWSLATAACGLAGSFGRLFAARAMVGVGEASLNPAAYSMIADYFPAGRRGVATAIFACGASLGGGLAILAGGQVVQWALATRPQLPFMHGAAAWQTAFVVIGLPGLLVALLIALTVREPARMRATEEAGEAPGFADVGRFIAAHWRVFLPVFAGFSCVAINGYAFTVWGPAYFMRLHGLTPGSVGLLFGIGYGAGGTLGVLAGGALSDRLVRRGRVEAPILVTLGAVVVQAPLFVVAYLAPDALVAEIAFCLAMFVASMVGGLQVAMVQSIAPNRMRGLLAALYGACVNVAGLGIAPTLTAFASDHLFGGPQGIGKALAATSALSLALALVLILLGLGPARRLAARLADQPINSPPSTGSTIPVT
jgi:MFS family permease